METQDIELQDLPTVATNDIPPDSLIPIAFRESNLTPFELYKITLAQLRVVLSTLNIEEIYEAFEKDPELTNILFELQNNLIIINYDETTLNNLLNDVQTFIIPQINEILFALTNQTTGSLYNLFQELTSIYNILDYLQQQTLNAMKTLILSAPDRINDQAPYGNDQNYGATNNDYNFYLDGFYNYVYLNIFIDTDINFNREVPIRIFKVQDVFVPLTLSPEKNIMEFKINLRIDQSLKGSLNEILAARPITFYRSTGTGVNSVLYTLSFIDSPLAEGNNFSFSIFFNKEGYIANSWNATNELLSEQDIPRINQELAKKLKYVLNDNSINFLEDGCFFASKIANPINNNINVTVANLTDLKNRLFVLDVDCTNISDPNINFSISLGLLATNITLPNPQKRALFLISSELDIIAQTLSGTILLDGINSESVTELSITDETQITINNAENVIIYQTVNDFQDERTINLEIIANSLKTLKIILDVEAVENYYKAYSFTIGAITKTLPLIWIGDENKALNQIDKIEINFNIDKDFLSTTILNSHQLTNSIADFVIEQTKLIGNQLFSLNLYLPLGVLSNRSSLNDPFGSASYTASNISLDIPERENEYRFCGGLYAKTFDNATSDRVVITQNVHLTDWNVQNGIKIEKTADEKALYVFVDNVNKKYYCKFDLQLSRDFNSDLDIVFLLDAPTAIIDAPNPNFTTTYGYQIAGHVEIFRKTIPFATPNNSILEFVLDVDTGVATEEPYAEPIVNRFDSDQYWTIPEIEAYVAQEIAIIISGGTIDLSGYATIQQLNDAIALLVPLNQYNIDQNIVNNRLDALENRVDDIEDNIDILDITVNNLSNQVNDIQVQIGNIDDTLIDLQDQINNIDGVSIEYVNNINSINQVRIVNPSVFYEIVYPIPQNAIVIEKDIPLSAIKDRYLGLLDDGLPINTEVYIHLKINIVKDQTEWEKQYNFSQKQTANPDVITRISDPMPIDPQGNYQIPTYINFGSFAKRVNPQDVSFFATAASDPITPISQNPNSIFANLQSRNTAFFDTNEIIKRVLPTYTPRFFVEQFVGSTTPESNFINNVITEAHLTSTNNVNKYSISALNMNHSCKMPIHLIFALNKRRIIYFEINNPYASQTDVVFTMYHENEVNVSMIQAKNYQYQLFALFSNAYAVSLKNFASVSKPSISTSSPYYVGAYSVANIFKSIKLLDENYYNQPIVQVEFTGDLNESYESTVYNPLTSYDTNFIYSGRFFGGLSLFSNSVYFRSTNLFNINFASLFLPVGVTTAQRNFFLTYAQNCIGDYDLTYATNTVSESFPYQHLWQILEYNWKAKYIIEDTDLFLATDLYDGTINNVEETELYFSAYKNTATTSAVQPYDAANENRVFVLRCYYNPRAAFTVGAIPYISANFYNNVLLANNMKIGISMLNISEESIISGIWIVEGSINLINFFDNMFLYSSSGIQSTIHNDINTFVTNNPIRPFVRIVLDLDAGDFNQKFHKKNATDNSTNGVCSYNVVLSSPFVFFSVLTSLPSPTNINNT